MRQVELAAFFKGQLQRYNKKVVKIRLGMVLLSGAKRTAHCRAATLLGKAVHFVNGAAVGFWEVMRAAFSENKQKGGQFH